MSSNFRIHCPVKTGFTVQKKRIAQSEQFDNLAVLDDSADLYQAAGVCVFLLTGKRPIDVDDDDLEDDEYYSACRKLQMNGLSRDIADDKLKAVLARALLPNPSDRFRNVQELIDALQVLDVQ